MFGRFLVKNDVLSTKCSKHASNIEFKTCFRIKCGEVPICAMMIFDFSSHLYLVSRIFYVLARQCSMYYKILFLFHVGKLIYIFFFVSKQMMREKILFYFSRIFSRICISICHFEPKPTPKFYFNFRSVCRSDIELSFFILYLAQQKTNSGQKTFSEQFLFQDISNSSL